MPQDYLSCLAVALREIHGSANICQTDCGIPSKLEFPPYSEVMNGSATFKLTKG